MSINIHSDEKKTDNAFEKTNIAFELSGKFSKDTLADTSKNAFKYTKNQLNHKSVCFENDQANSQVDTSLVQLRERLNALRQKSKLSFNQYSSVKIEKPIIYGFSDGGIEALLIAYRYPNLLSRIIISGANINPDGINGIDKFMMRLSYFFRRDKRTKMMIKEPNITQEDLAKIVIPVNIIAGEYDAIREAHTRALHKWINGSTLYIVPREDHGSYIIHSDKIYKILKQYI